MRIAFAAARSAPGVTTAALALASVWPGRVLLVEASEDGGAIAARFGLKLEPGATTLAAAIRHAPDPVVLWSHAQPLPATEERVVALVAPPAAEAAQMLLRTAGDRLARLLDRVEGATVFVDAGRLPPSPAAAPLIAGADRFVLVARPRVEELQALGQRLPVLRELGADPQLLLVGRHPYGPDEVASTLGCPVLGVLADDRAAADALAGVVPARRLRRSPLLRSATTLVDRILSAPSAPKPMPDLTAASWTPSTGSPRA